MNFPVLILNKTQFLVHYRNSGSGQNNFNKLDFQFVVTPNGASDFDVTLVCYALKFKREPMHSAPLKVSPYPGGRIDKIDPPFKFGTLEIDKNTLRDVGIGDPNHETFEFLRLEASVSADNYIFYKVFRDNDATLVAKAANPCPPAPQR